MDEFLSLKASFMPNTITQFSSIPLRPRAEFTSLNLMLSYEERRVEREEEKASRARKRLNVKLFVPSSIQCLQPHQHTQHRKEGCSPTLTHDKKDEKRAPKKGKCERDKKSLPDISIPFYGQSSSTPK